MFVFVIPVVSSMVNTEWKAEKNAYVLLGHTTCSWKLLLTLLNTSGSFFWKGKG